MENQIKLVTVPVIQHALIEVGKSVTERLDALNIENVIATEDTVKGLKNLRADLNKELTEYESQRKAIKEGVLSPYEAFESVYKTEVSDKYKNAINLLKDKIAVVEDKMKDEKKEAVKSYFVELCLSEDIDFVSFPQVGLEINLSTSEKAYKEKCNEFIQRIADDLRLIDTQEHKAEILVEYKKTLNASRAIKDVQDRKAAERAEQERIKQAEIQRRSTLLRSLTMVYRDFTKTFEHVSDPEIYIDNSFFENASKEDFQKKIIEIEEKIKAKKAAEVKTSEPAHHVMETLANQAPVPKPTAPTPEPLKPPVVESKPVEELKTASFEVTGTLTQLRALGEYLRQNNITYKNI